ncbi:DUF3857 domain-containing protein [Mucilaginibacter sp. BT774]|uniref:DUF3857 domain-containing protein n=1 Tax=Mucilaginibacter sp. BT774 TaxID=3062276 RepID=UPI002674D01D|nr:DUF3857 domain-containing protein [Mucilaginibacter sp. BT774]MDO3627024.1 DUF3857 domain-containing protein [Mucilaginibacter sp. BT774]
MNKIFTLMLLGAFCTAANAQTTIVPTTQPYGKVDLADLEMKACDFEKDANAEVLFDKGNVYYGSDLGTITNEVHRRIKIFNDNGKSQADIHISYYGGNHLEYITGIQAETINLVDGKMEITKLDKKLIYTKTIDKWRNEITFTMPNVKSGCIIEYKYNFNSNNSLDIPDWEFQDKIPVRYSEYTTGIPDLFYFREQPHLTYPLVKNTRTSEGRSLVDNSGSYPYSLEMETKAMANVPSLPDEPFMSSFTDNVQEIRYQLVSIKPIGGFVRTGTDTWAKVGGKLIDDEDFGGQLRRKLNNEDAIVSKAKGLKTDVEKMAYVFNEVKNSMKWNGKDDWYTIDGTYRAWENKTGNSAEINLILYHLLKESGLEVYPMVVSTKEHGKVLPFYTSTIQFNRAVVYVPIDSTKRYVLDATNKYNLYNQTPSELLNSSGLWIDKKSNHYDIVFLHNDVPVRQIVLVTGEVKPDGKLTGTAQISSNGYNKINAVEKYKTDGEKKYIDYLRDDDNNLKISSLKMQDMEVDSLPLTQNIEFNLELAGSDENYIYLNPNLFTSLKTNPFLSEKRMTDIDFRYLRNYSVNGMYKIPAGYKIDALPKNVTIVMPDKSVSFKRLVAEQDGSIIVRYSINYNKVEYPKEDYADFHEFFKQMHQMLNEQIILKKG